MARTDYKEPQDGEQKLKLYKERMSVVMKRRKVIAALTAIFVVCVLMAGCSEDNLVKETDEKATIGIKNGLFDITMDQCIALLNEDIKKENLPLISTEYDSEEVRVSPESKNGETMDENDDEVFTIYRVEISDTIQFQMRGFKRFNGGIPIIEIRNTAEKNSDSDDAKLIKKYFNIICKNVEPRFNAEEFNIDFASNSHYELGDLYFWCGRLNSGEDEVERIYYVTTNSDLFSFYI